MSELESALKWYEKPADEFLEWATKYMDAHWVGSTDLLPIMVELLSRFPVPSGHQWALFQSYWSSCDNAPRDVLDELFSLFSFDTLGVDHLQGEDLAFFNGLPETVTLFRGASPDKRRGYSWTTSEVVAEGFAVGHRGIRNPRGTIYRGTAHKSKIWTVFGERDEAEILLDPASVQRLEVHRRIMTRTKNP